jgi:DNA-directed RNA polymerase subunit RPC12/RpoP
MMLFLPLSPDEVMEEIGRLLDRRQREKKPSAWVFSECNAWEDLHRFQIAPVYGRFYHISAQARRVADGEIAAEEMRADLQKQFHAYWGFGQLTKRFLVGSVKMIGLALLFFAVGLVNYGLAAWIGSVPAAGIIIGILLAIVLIPQLAGEYWKWRVKRSDDRTVEYQQTILGRLRMVFFYRCPKCGRYLGDQPLDDDGSVRCACGYRIERKTAPTQTTN